MYIKIRRLMKTPWHSIKIVPVFLGGEKGTKFRVRELNSRGEQDEVQEEEEARHPP